MISAGYIGGGKSEPAAPPPQQPPPPSFSLGPDGFGVAVPMSQQKADEFVGDTTLKDFLTQGYVGMGVNFGAYIGGAIIQAVIANGQFEMWKTINNRKAEAAENISTDRRATEEKWIDFMGKADNRMNAPGGLRERLARIESNRDIEMYDRRMESQERIAAMRNLDSAFSLRGEYNYGSPYA